MQHVGVNDWMSAAELPGSNVITFFIGNKEYVFSISNWSDTDRQTKQPIKKKRKRKISIFVLVYRPTKGHLSA